MPCSNCGVIVQEDRETCQNCGARVYPAAAYSPSMERGAPARPSYVKNIIEKEAKKARYRLIGILLIIIGIILFIVGLMAFVTFGEWIMFTVSFILIGAGFITLVSNMKF